MTTVALLGCGSAEIPDLNGLWNTSESFADDVHLISCVSQGTFTISQPSSAELGGSTPGPNFTGTLDNSNDCTSQDGPFTYVGGGAISAGVVTIPGETVSFDATVNDAECRYNGTVHADGGFVSDMAGTLTCTLVQAGVTFNFAGTWEARNWRSDWCAARRDQPGCAAP